MILEMMALSDNNFYSSFYHFLGPKTIYYLLEARNYSGTNIYKAFTGCERKDQLKTNEVVIYDSDGYHFYTYPKQELDTIEMLTNYSYSENRLFGSKHEDENGDIVDGPYDLNYNLELPLLEANNMFIGLMYPYHIDFAYYLR